MVPDVIENFEKPALAPSGDLYSPDTPLKYGITVHFGS